MVILVLEASTSSAKAMLYDSGGGVLSIAARPYSSDTGDTMTFDADALVDETIRAGRDVLARAPEQTVDMVAVCSIWSHSLVLLDSEKKPISRLSTWADTGASVTTSRYRKNAELFTSLYRRTGCPIHVTYTIWKYIHEKENRLSPPAAYIASMPDYLYWKLTGRFAASRSTASAGGFLNIHRLDWDDEALRLAGVRPDMLPELVDSEYTAPLSAEAAEQLGIPAGLPVLVPGADGCMNQIASGAVGENVMTISVGTSAALRLTTDRPLLAETPSTWCYVGVENTWIVGSAIAGAGNCVDWTGRKILGCEGVIDFDELDRGAERALEKGDAPLFLPFLAGERCPGWDDARTGALVGLKITHDRHDLYYATLEGVLFNLKQCYDITVAVAGRTPERISVSGGIEHSPFWMRMAASVLGLPVYAERQPHASLLGTAILALKAAGSLSSVRDVRPSPQDCYEPDTSKAVFFADRYRKYLEFYAKLSERRDASP